MRHHGPYAGTNLHNEFTRCNAIAYSHLCVIATKLGNRVLAFLGKQLGEFALRIHAG